MEIRIIADLNTHFIRAPIHCTGKHTITQNYGYSSYCRNQWNLIPEGGLTLINIKEGFISSRKGHVLVVLTRELGVRRVALGFSGVWRLTKGLLKR